MLRGSFMTVKRNTIQKTVVLDAVNSLKNHATADDVYHEIVKTHPSISRGTVYRNLNQLTESGDIRKVEVPNGADRFDHRAFKHYHAKCSVCGQILDVEMDYIEDLEKAIKNACGFEFSSHDIMFKGMCTKCAEIK